MCSILPNHAYWQSYVRAFHVGGNPWLGSFEQDGADRLVSSNASLSEAEWAFIHAQRDKEVAAGYWSKGSHSRLPYMRTGPLAAASKPEKTRFCMIQNASAPRGDLLYFTGR